MVQAYNCFLLFAHVITLKPLQEEIKIVKTFYVFLPFFFVDTHPFRFVRRKNQQNQTSSH